MNFDPEKWGGFDTETQDGKAIVLGTDRGATYTPDLSLKEAIAFLLDDGRENYAAFNLGYDARAIFWTMPFSAIQTLNRTGSVQVGKANVRYIDRKHLRIRYGKRVVKLWDCQVFYQSSLEKAAQDTLGEGKEDIPKEWYPRMGSIMERGGKDALKVLTYCQKDADLARRLMLHVLEKAERMGLHVPRPYSPGSLAIAYFRKEIPRPPNQFTQAVFQKSFYGGRAEIFRRGTFKTAVQYDINSAYPAAFNRIPSPENASFVDVDRESASRKGPHPDAIYGTYRIEANVPFSTHIPLFPLRTRDGLIYPAGRFKTWTDAETLREAVAHPETAGTFRVLRGWELRHPSPKRLFTDTEELFKMRKSEPQNKMIVKLILNSLYGKLASAIERWKPARIVDAATPYDGGKYWERSLMRYGYTHFALAASITARVRVKLWNLLNANGRKWGARPIYCATDSATFEREPTFPVCEEGRLLIGSDLGQWGLKAEFQKLTVVSSGIGFGFEYQKFGPKAWIYQEIARGIKCNRKLGDLFNSPQAKRASILCYQGATVDGIGRLIASEDIEKFNVIRRALKRIDVNADRKRVWPHPWKRAADVLQSCQDSESRIIV